VSRAAAYPERIVPDETEPGIVALHLKRYDFARAYCAGKDVLDAGCGVGYGTFHLAQSARLVVGIDRSDEAIAYARGRYAAPNADFTTGDLLALDVPDASFDVVCAFEAIEHLADPEAFLDEVARVLRADGLFLASTPRAEETVAAPDNPFHSVELSREDFERLLRRRFAHVELYGQRRLQTTRHRLARRLDVLGLRRSLPALRRLARPLLGTAPMAEVTLEEIEISREALADASELVAVCR
jgi:SAM-dependent methyltransferase